MEVTNGPMTPKAYWERPTWEFPSPTTPLVPNGGDANPSVDPYGPLVV